MQNELEINFNPKSEGQAVVLDLKWQIKSANQLLDEIALNGYPESYGSIHLIRLLELSRLRGRTILSPEQLQEQSDYYSELTRMFGPLTHVLIREYRIKQKGLTSEYFEGLKVGRYKR
jgi:hypothetical protein